MRPSARTGPVSFVSGRTKLNLSSSVVQVSPLAIVEKIAQPSAEFEQRRGEAAVHRANWIVVVEFRYALEYGASLFGFNQVKAHEPADRRIRHRAGDDCFQEAKAVVGFENIGRDDAVGLAAHNAPASLRYPCMVLSLQ